MKPLPAYRRQRSKSKHGAEHESALDGGAVAPLAVFHSSAAMGYQHPLEENMDEDFGAFLHTLPALPEREFPSEYVMNQFIGILPKRLLVYWKQYGWGGFGDGIFWLVNPLEYNATLQTWCHGITNLSVDTQVIGRSAFGELIVWKKDHGRFLRVVPLEQTIYTFAPNKHVLSGKEDFSIGILISQLSQDMLDFEDEQENPLFKRAVKKLGSVSSDEMYAFEPALALGGRARIESLVKVNMKVHLELLAQLADIEVMHIDTTRFAR